MLTRSKSFQAFWSDTISKNSEVVKDEKGQTVVEFVLLFLVIISLSFGLLVGINKGVANVWIATVKIIAEPTDTDIQYP